MVLQQNILPSQEWFSKKDQPLPCPRKLAQRRDPSRPVARYKCFDAGKTLAQAEVGAVKIYAQNYLQAPAE